MSRFTDTGFSLATALGGTGLNIDQIDNGALLIGDGIDFTLATITAGSGVTIVNSSGGILISATGSGGTVTSVGLSAPSIFNVAGSPVTGAGTLALTLANENANLVFSGPSTGSPAGPTFRALVAADIPSIPDSKINFANENANLVLAGPTTGGAATPGFRALVAADIPGLAASKITSGQLATARGGTGVDSSAASNGQLLIGNGSGLTLSTLTAGSNVTITNASGTITIASTGGGGGGGGGNAFSAHSEKSSNYTLTTSDVMVVATASSLTFTLPAASTLPAGQYLVIKNDENSTATTITPNGTDKIDGANTYNLPYVNNAVILVSNGSSKFRIV